MTPPRHKILLIDDDFDQLAETEEEIRQRFGPDIEIVTMTRERDFKDRFDEVENAGFSLIIIDQMIPYGLKGDAEQDAEGRQALVELNVFRGGTRCYALLQRPERRTKDIPVIFYTILDKEKVPAGVPYVKKAVDTTILIDKVRKALG